MSEYGGDRLKIDTINNQKIEDVVNRLLTYTGSLANQLYWIEEEFDVLPSKDHFGLAINHIDIIEKRDEFIEELVNTIIDWVYNSKKSREIIEELTIEEGRGINNAYSKLRRLAFSKFRVASSSDRLILQGQFGELLLFNLLQHFWNAVPLLRKMNITTSVGQERFGADAIHYKYENNTHYMILGEAKAYTSKGSFKGAFKKALSSIIDTFNSINPEMNLYVYDDFIDDDLAVIAKSFKNSTLENCVIHLVCIIAYDEKTNINKMDEKQIKNDIKKIIEDEYASIEKEAFDAIAPGVLKKITYIAFPIWEMSELIKKFEREVNK